MFIQNLRGAVERAEGTAAMNVSLTAGYRMLQHELCISFDSAGGASETLLVRRWSAEQDRYYLIHTVDTNGEQYVSILNKHHFEEGDKLVITWPNAGGLAWGYERFHEKIPTV